MLPEKSVGKVLEATVVAAGPGARSDKGETIPMAVKVAFRYCLSRKSLHWLRKCVMNCSYERSTLDQVELATQRSGASSTNN